MHFVGRTRVRNGFTAYNSSIGASSVDTDLCDAFAGFSCPFYLPTFIATREGETAGINLIKLLLALSLMAQRASLLACD